MSTVYRLPPDLQADLVWFWCEEESELGVRSNMSAAIATLERKSKPKRKREVPAPPESGVDLVERVQAPRLALADPRIDRQARKRAAIEAYWYTMHVGAEKPSGGSTGPDRSIDQVRRSSRVQGALVRLRRGENGVRHQRVLFRVYGDPMLSLRQDETTQLARYAKTPAGRRELLSEASRAYAEAHAAEKAERVEEKRARFRAILGAA